MRAGNLDTIRLSTQSIRIMCAMLREAGLSADDLLAEAEISPSLLDDPRAEIESAVELRCQHVFARMTKHIPGLWMRTGLRYRAMSYGPLGLAVLAAADVSEALDVFSAFQALTFSLVHYVVEHDQGSPVALRADDSQAPPELREFLQERALGSVTTSLNDIQPPHFPLVRIESALDRPTGWQGCDALLNVPVFFNARATRWVFEDGVGGLALPMASPLLEETYRRLCSELVGAEPRRDEFLSSLYELMVRSGRGFPSAAAAARKLNISERSLHRRLSAQSTSFGAVLDKVRYQRAQEILSKSTLSIERISEMLGFAETASFSRAFRRWSGSTPSAYRQQHSSP